MENLPKISLKSSRVSIGSFSRDSLRFFWWLFKVSFTNLFSISPFIHAEIPSNLYRYSRSLPVIYLELQNNKYWVLNQSWIQIQKIKLSQHWQNSQFSKHSFKNWSNRIFSNFSWNYFLNSSNDWCINSSIIKKISSIVSDIRSYKVCLWNFPIISLITLLRFTPKFPKDSKENFTKDSFQNCF